MHDTKGVSTYLLALCTFLSVCQPHVLYDFLLAVVQIPGLCQKDAFSLFVFSDGIEGLTHTLSSGLMRTTYVT